MIMQTIPPLSVDLIEALKAAFPKRNASALFDLSPRELDFYCGQQSLIELLDTRLSQSKDDVLSA